MMLKARDLDISSASIIRFQKKFGFSWSDAVRSDNIHNAVDTAAFYGVSYERLHQAWMYCISEGKVVKLSRGLYCGLIDTIQNKPSVFCINGFFMAMRTEYLAPHSSIHYFIVEWDDTTCTWLNFRKRVIGETNPAFADSGSLRYILSEKRNDFGLQEPLDIMKNGIHASASAFESLVERSLWLRAPVEEDEHFGVSLISSAIPQYILKEWMCNPAVNGKYIFDCMENMGTEQCLEVALELYRQSHGILHCTAFFSSVI